MKQQAIAIVRVDHRFYQGGMDFYVTANGGMGSLAYQLFVYDPNSSLVYETNLQSSPSLVWVNSLQSNLAYDGYTVVVRIYDALGYMEYAAVMDGRQIFTLSVCLRQPYQKTVA